MKEIEENFTKIVEMFEQRRINAYRKVNEENIILYYDVGKYIYKLKYNTSYGDKIIENIAIKFKDNYPQIKGFNKRNLERMVRFYTVYKDDEIATPLVTQLSWSNNLIILSRTKTKEERLFYLKLSVRNNYSKRELDRQISSAYYERYQLSSGKLTESLTKTIDEDDYPNTKILDSYSLEFLNLPELFSEKDLRKGIVSNLKSFILEIGKDFTFVGEEYRVQVGSEDFYIDLLFYNRELSCLVAFELKIDKFKPEYVSKMDFYLEALDRQEKRKNENPSIGVILCAGKDREVVEYAMSRSLSQTTVAEYKLKLIDKKILENKLKEIIAFIEENTKQLYE